MNIKIFAYLKEFFFMAFGVTALMLLVIICIALFFLPWLLAVYLDMQGASIANCFLLVVLMYAMYYVIGRSFGMIDDPRLY